MPSNSSPFDQLLSYSHPVLSAFSLHYPTQPTPQGPRPIPLLTTTSPRLDPMRPDPTRPELSPLALPYPRPILSSTNSSTSPQHLSLRLLPSTSPHPPFKTSSHVFVASDPMYSLLQHTRYRRLPDSCNTGNPNTVLRLGLPSASFGVVRLVVERCPASSTQ